MIVQRKEEKEKMCQELDFKKLSSRVQAQPRCCTTYCTGKCKYLLYAEMKSIELTYTVYVLYVESV